MSYETKSELEQSKSAPISDEVRKLAQSLPIRPDSFKADECAAVARDAVAFLAEIRKGIIHGGAWTKRVDALMERARVLGL